VKKRNLFIAISPMSCPRTKERAIDKSTY